MSKIKFHTPTNVSHFMSCKYILFNKKHKKELGLKPKEISLTNKLRIEKGKSHENNWLSYYKKKYKKVISLKGKKINLNTRLKNTINAMKKGFDVIHGGYLKLEQWEGEFDFLIKKSGIKTKFGHYGYAIADAKYCSKARAKHLVQLGIYADCVSHYQGKNPENLTVLLKHNDTESVQLSEIEAYLKKNKKDFEDFVTKKIETAVPEKCSWCSYCEWENECKNIWRKEDNINQIANIHKRTIHKLKKQNITTMKMVSELKKNSSVTEIPDKTLTKLVGQAKLQVKFKNNGKMSYKILEDNDDNIRRGFYLLPEKTKCDLFFDIESVGEHIFANGLEYLFGIYYEENKEKKFKDIWAHNHEEEKKSTIQFFEFTRDHFEKYPDAKIYHYGHYETTALSRLTSKYKVKEQEFRDYLRQGKFIDLLKIVKQGTQISIEDYSLKSVERIFDMKRSGDVVKADESENFYAMWIESEDDNYLEQIKKYNYQDCFSTYELRNWLLKIRPENKNYISLSEDEGYKTDADLIELKLLNAINDSKNLDKNLKNILSDIVGYYRRDLLEEWRAYFERKTMPDNELVDDLECIGELILTEEPYLDSRSYVYTYEYPEQEFKLKKGDDVVWANNYLSNYIDDDGIRQFDDKAGKIVSLDKSRRRICLKKGMKQRLPENLSIGPTVMSFLNTKMSKRLESFVENNIDKELPEYKATFEILRRDYPDIRNLSKGDKIITTSDFKNEIPKIISNLNNSYIVIQGPPGTGKTYSAADTIIELINQDKTIGVTSNSHKAIHNLLESMEKIAHEKNINFRGLKKFNTSKEESKYESKFDRSCYIENSADNKDFSSALIENDIRLHAGTKFHFANNDSYQSQALDYLFVDEAGQLSLADIISIGSVAKNIVLIGDPMQLANPSSAIHPGESGKSILNYILDGKDTIDENKGIFLDKTFRLHRSINAFISSTFYDSRLNSDPITDKRKIIFPKNSIIQESGIYFYPVQHQYNSQKSIEEACIVKKLYEELLGSEFIYEKNKKRELGIEDILTVSPYNVQVNYLQANLGDEARVGTIDKFQGQQAPITIITMATSDSESIPRGKRWLFERNRINVAVSRAQLISIIIFNPNLLQTNCSNIKEMKLLNTFCKLTDYKTIGF